MFFFLFLKLNFEKKKDYFWKRESEKERKSIKGNMTKLKSLSISGIRNFGPDEEKMIKFEKPLTVISGMNGCGKTTVIECLKFATTGTMPPNSQSGQSFVYDPNIAKQNEVKGLIKLIFETRERKKCCIIRRMEVKRGKDEKLTFKQIDTTLAVHLSQENYQTISTKASEVDQSAPLYFGASRAMLESVIFCHQEDTAWPLQDSKEVKAKFDNIFESSRYAKALAEIKSQRKEHVNTASALDKDVASLTQYRTEAEIKRTEKVNLQADLKSLEAESASLESQLFNVKSEVTEFESKARQVEANKQILQKLEIETKIHQSNASKREMDLKHLPSYSKCAFKSVSDMDQLLEQHERVMGEQQRALKSLESTRDTLKVKQVELEQNLQKSQEANTRVEVLTSKLQDAKNNIVDMINSMCLRDELETSAKADMRSIVSKSSNVNEFEKDIELIARVLDQQRTQCHSRLNALQASFDAHVSVETKTIENHKSNEREVTWNLGNIKNKAAELKSKIDASRAELQQNTGPTAPVTEKMLDELNATCEKLHKEKLQVEESAMAMDFTSKFEALKVKNERLVIVLEHAEGEVVKYELKQQNMLQLESKRTQATFDIEASVTKVEGIIRDHSKEITSHTLDALCNIQKRLVQLPVDFQQKYIHLQQSHASMREIVESFEKNAEEARARYRKSEQSVRQSEINKGRLESEIVAVQQNMSSIRSEILKLEDGNNLEVHFDEATHEQAFDAYVQVQAEVVELESMIAQVEKSQTSNTPCCPTCQQGFSSEWKPSIKIMDSNFINESGEILQTFDVNTHQFSKGTRLQGVQLFLACLFDRLRQRTPERDRTKLIYEASEKQRLEFLNACVKNEQFAKLNQNLQSATSKLESLNANLTQEQNEYIALAKLCKEDQQTVDAMGRLRPLLDSSCELFKKATESTKGVMDFAQANDLYRDLLNNLAGDAQLSSARIRLADTRKEIQDIASEKERLQFQERENEKRLASCTENILACERERDQAQQFMTDLAQKRRNLQDLEDELVRLEQSCDTYSKDLENVNAKLASVMKDLEAFRCKNEPEILLAQQYHKIIEGLYGDCVRIQRQYTTDSTLLREAVETNNRSRISNIKEELTHLLSVIHDNNGAICTSSDKLKKLQEEENDLKQFLELSKLQQELKGKQLALENASLALKLSQGNPPVDFEAELQSRHLASTSIQVRLSNLNGRMVEMRNQHQKLSDTLISTSYKDIDARCKSAILKRAASKMAADDLVVYLEAFHKALLDFHTERIEQVNKTIKELWQMIYFGGDIDRIEIISKKGEKSDGHNYRVVMVKNNVALEMRGRCSAGQKVLASLVIRMALAETFCSDCGVFTLDEPTTNLDQKNKEGFASALARVLERNNVKNRFQFILITHDDDFVNILNEELNKIGSEADYYEVKREFVSESKGYPSTIEKK